MTGTIAEVSVKKIFANPNQPRKDFDESKLEELAMSIREYGVLEPIVVTPRKDGLMIIAGERRFRASLLAGRETIPARTIEADDALVEELALLENIQRQDLNVIEEAKAYESLLNRGWTKEGLATKMGFKQVWRIDERLSLLNLSAEFQNMVIGKAGVTLSHSQAFEVSRVSHGRQAEVVGKILRGELNTYNKLRSFVDALLALERQTEIFALSPLTESEKDSIGLFQGLIGTIERFIKKVNGEGSMKHLEKAVLHSDISVDRIDLIIRSLQKIRKAMLVGDGLRQAGGKHD